MMTEDPVEISQVFLTAPDNNNVLARQHMLVEPPD